MHLSDADTYFKLRFWMYQCNPYGADLQEKDLSLQVCFIISCAAV